MTAPKYCTQCGGTLELRKLEDERWPQPSCPRCGHVEWQNPKPTASALITRTGANGPEVLLVRRARPPHEGAWDCPGGFLDPDEHPEDALRRECREELAVEVQPGQIVGIFMDRYGKDGEHTLNIYFEAKIRAGSPSPGSDVSEVRWFPLKRLPEPIAFDNNRQALNTIRDRLQSQGTTTTPA